VILALLSAGSFTSDICRAEQGRALDKGKCILPLRVQSDCDIPLQLPTCQWLDFSNLRLYPEQLPKLIESIEKRVGVELPAELLIRYNNAPSLPQNFVNRPELLEALRNTLFTEGENRNTAITAIQSMGGIGKTVLANGAAFGAREFTANLLTEDESRQVLAKWSGRPAEGLPPQASEVIHECGYLPLALAMIGAQLRGKPPRFLWW